MVSSQPLLRYDSSRHPIGAIHGVCRNGSLQIDGFLGNPSNPFPASQVHDDSIVADPGIYPLVEAHVNDPFTTHCDSLRPTAHRIHRINGAMAEHHIGGLSYRLGGYRVTRENQQKHQAEPADPDMHPFPGVEWCHTRNLAIERKLMDALVSNVGWKAPRPEIVPPGILMPPEPP